MTFTCGDATGWLSIAFSGCAVLVAAFMFFDLRKHTRKAMDAQLLALVWRALANLAEQWARSGRLSDAEAGLLIGMLSVEYDNGGDAQRLIETWIGAWDGFKARRAALEVVHRDSTGVVQ